MAVKNRFQELEDEGNGASYENFVEANRQAMEEYVPSKPKRNTVRTSTNPRVMEARVKAEEAHNRWDTNS